MLNYPAIDRWKCGILVTATCCQGSKRATQAPLLGNMLLSPPLPASLPVGLPFGSNVATPYAPSAGWLYPFKRCGHPTPHAMPPTCRSAHFVCVSRTLSQSVCVPSTKQMRLRLGSASACTTCAVRLNFGKCSAAPRFSASSTLGERPSRTALLAARRA